MAHVLIFRIPGSSLALATTASFFREVYLSITSFICHKKTMLSWEQLPLEIDYLGIPQTSRSFVPLTLPTLSFHPMNSKHFISICGLLCSICLPSVRFSGSMWAVASISITFLVCLSHVPLCGDSTLSSLSLVTAI